MGVHTAKDYLLWLFLRNITIIVTYSTVCFLLWVCTVMQQEDVWVTAEVEGRQQQFCDQCSRLWTCELDTARKMWALSLPPEVKEIFLNLHVYIVGVINVLSPHWLLSISSVQLVCFCLSSECTPTRDSFRFPGKGPWFHVLVVKWCRAPQHKTSGSNEEGTPVQVHLDTGTTRYM